MTVDRLERMYRANEQAGAPPYTLSKSTLVEGFYDGSVVPMAHDIFTPAYGPINYFSWALSRNVDKVAYLMRFEPYYIARVPVPLFNETFVNRGGNFAQQVLEMHAAGYEFYRMPDAFVVDIPHVSVASRSAAQAANRTTSPDVDGQKQPQRRAARVPENHTKWLPHDAKFIDKLWVAFSEWVSHRYGHNLPTPLSADPAFRKYRKAQDKVLGVMFRLLATREAENVRG